MENYKKIIVRSVFCTLFFSQAHATNLNCIAWNVDEEKNYVSFIYIGHNKDGRHEFHFSSSDSVLGRTSGLDTIEFNDKRQDGTPEKTIYWGSTVNGGIQKSVNFSTPTPTPTPSPISPQSSFDLDVTLRVYLLEIGWSEKVIKNIQVKMNCTSSE